MKETRIAIIGLGYVGLPLAIEFSKKFKVIGYDINRQRVSELEAGVDHTKEANEAELKFVIDLNFSSPTCGLSFSYLERDLTSCNVFIVTVPTPITKYNMPDLKPLLSASQMLGRVIKKDDVVIYESTTYPGCTEEDCVPEIEKTSGLKFNKDFHVGYSPERINPGDKVNTLTKIQKVTSGSTPQIADFVDKLYQSIITAGTHKAPNIKVAEASKIIENAQRDVNISFMNELALIFDRIGIDTADVIDAASTKWNFLKYRPGLVGGHCISIDPYYLASKAESLGYVPHVILSGRQVNNSIAPFIANKVLKLMVQNSHSIKGADVLILGITFKENCPDIRNSKVVDIYRELVDFGLKVDVYDPWASPQEVKCEFDITLINNIPQKKDYQAVILAVCHDEFKTINFKRYKNQGSVIFDVKGFIDRDLVDSRL